MAIPRMRFSLSAITLAAVAAMPACAARADGQRRAGSDRVKIIGVSPDPTRLLRPGQTVTFRVKVRVTLAHAELGRVTLVVQDNRGRTLTGEAPQSRMFVARGSEQLEIFDEATVGPDARTVELFVALFHEGATSSIDVDTVRFEVAGFK